MVDRRPAFLLIAVVVAAAILQLVVGGETRAGLIALLDVALVAATMAVIGFGVVDQGEINL